MAKANKGIRNEQKGSGRWCGSSMCFVTFLNIFIRASTDEVLTVHELMRQGYA